MHFSFRPPFDTFRPVSSQFPVSPHLPTSVLEPFSFVLARLRIATQHPVRDGRGSASGFLQWPSSVVHLARPCPCAVTAHAPIASIAGGTAPFFVSHTGAPHVPFLLSFSFLSCSLHFALRCVALRSEVDHAIVRATSRGFISGHSIEAIDVLRIAPVSGDSLL